MADYDNRVLRGQASTAGYVDAGLRSYMLRIYNYMLAGLVLTGLTSYGAFLAAVTTNSEAAAARLPNGVLLTSFGVALFTGPLMWVLLFASLGLVLFLSFRINKMSVTTAQISFLAYAAVIGLTMASIFVVYTQSSIAQVFFVTAATFGAMSLWGYTTRTDLTAFGSFLFMGLIGLVIASLVSYFVHSTMLTWIISVAGVLIFTGLTAYDTQWIKNNYLASDDAATSGKKAIFGALKLYLDFINLFLMLLRLMGSRR
ncbi:MAG: Bax inhibitor-1/YccA family protein [Rhizomicrobium sp.]